MNVARVLYPVEVLGPGKRVGIWTCGCYHRCRGCSNPELWKPREEYEIEPASLVNGIKASLGNAPVDGFVITGGDPFYQAKELSLLLALLQSISDDILVYTGFTYEELLQSTDVAVAKCLDSISVLIDGPYIEEYNDGSLLRGSHNQKILFLDKSIQPKYEVYLRAIGTNQIQNFTVDNGVISVGIHRRGFADSIVDTTIRKGITFDG